MKSTAKDTLFLNLLKYHVLHTIGELSADKKQELQRVQTRLQALNNTIEYDANAEQHWALAQQQDIKSVWRKYKTWALQRGAVADPYDFATSYVDQNYELLRQGFISVYIKS